MSRPALVVLSGGQDSTTCLFWAKRLYNEIHAVTFDYGQKHAREIDAAYLIGQLAGVASHELVNVGPILSGRSPLTNAAEELETYTNFAAMDEIIGDRVEKTFVPMRNALFLTLAANKAVCRDVYDIVTGVCQADNANYPDCRRTFIDSQRHTIEQALGLRQGTFNIVTPLMDQSKAETVRQAYNMADCWHALAYSHTAYDGAYPPVGKDHASTLRAQGFLEASLPDPLVLRAWSEGAMSLPDSSNYTVPAATLGVNALPRGNLRDSIAAKLARFEHVVEAPYVS
jgi:7-cyano-7-deazaguanine synthase